MNCGYEIKSSYDLRSYERNFYNCVEKPEKFRTSTGFEPRGGDSHMAQTGMLVGNFEFNP